MLGVRYAMLWKIHCVILDLIARWPNTHGLSLMMILKSIWCQMWSRNAKVFLFCNDEVLQWENFYYYFGHSMGYMDVRMKGYSQSFVSISTKHVWSCAYFLSDLGEAFLVIKKKQLTTPRPPRPMRWIPPLSSLVKFNVHAIISRDNDHGAVGVVCKDENSKFWGSSTWTI
jgi:hypothetical protein